MTAEELWNQLVAAQTAFRGTETEYITQTKRGLKRLFSMAFNEGFKAGREKQRQEYQAMKRARKLADPFGFFTTEP